MRQLILLLRGVFSTQTANVQVNWVQVNLNVHKDFFKFMNYHSPDAGLT